MIYKHEYAYNLQSALRDWNSAGKTTAAAAAEDTVNVLPNAYFTSDDSVPVGTNQFERYRLPTGMGSQQQTRRSLL